MNHYEQINILSQKLEDDVSIDELLHTCRLLISHFNAMSESQTDRDEHLFACQQVAFSLADAFEMLDEHMLAGEPSLWERKDDV